MSMPAGENHGLLALSALRSRLAPDGSLEVIQEGGYTWRAYFTFNPSASAQSIEAAESQIGLTFPDHYRQFLMTNDGAVLYKDGKYGQWGFVVYGTDSLAAANVNWRRRNQGVWISSHLAFAESLGDGDVLVLDVGSPSRDGQDCRVVDGDSGYLPQKWDTAARSFSDWLDRLVVAQGAKYWRWR